ncbi:MAG: hypothetical protein E7447_01835 [Ruminococcaceae bacterium]|nr:hypothetical protein [Oscillospiraceae bacterium]
MKKSKLFRTAIAVILALVAVLAVSAAAAEYTTDDGMTFDVITTKETYGVNEEVRVILLAKNYNTNMKQANISWNASISEGELTLMSGELSGTQKVEVGERAAITLRLMKVVEKEEPPIDDPKPTDPTTPTQPTQPVEPDETQEPDGNATALVIVLIVVALAAIAVVVYLILKKRGILSCFVILLVLSMLLPCLPIMDVSAVELNPGDVIPGPSGEMNATVKFTVDGKEYEATATLTYELEDQTETKVEALGNAMSEYEWVDYNLPKITPTVGEHPRVMFTSADIPRIRETLESDAYYEVAAEFYRLLSIAFEGDFGASGKYNPDKLGSIAAKALYYALYKDSDNKFYANMAKNYGQTAVKAIIPAMKTIKFAEGFDIYTRGDFQLTASYVYDWCYDLLSHEEKQEIAALVQDIGAASECGWPIDIGFGDAVTSHSGGGLIQSSWMHVAIALYDEYPTIYEYIGGIYFDVFINPRNAWNVSGVHHQGTVYGVAGRYESDLNGQYLIYAMTGGMNDRDGDGDADGFVALDPIAQSVLYHGLYSMRPDAQLLREGDCWEENQTDRGEVWNTIALAAHKVSMFYKDGFAKRFAFEFSNVDFGRLDALFALLIGDVQVEAKTYATLPYTKYFPTPSGSMTARTGWEMGVESNDVLVRMQLTQAYLNNHQHRDAGNFQIYYKGILASESGYYVIYGTPHHTYYNQSSIAHNTLSITSVRNRYGVQNSEAITNWGVPGRTDLQTTVVGQEFGPNTYKPEYSYLAGDIAGAYQSSFDQNVQEAVRSMLFLNLELDGNTENPGAFIVFDQIHTLEVGSKKSFLLHMQSEPDIDGNTVVIKNTKDDYNGMLTNQVLYVGTAQNADENYTIEKIGGPGKQFLVGSYNYAHSDIITSTLSQEQGWGRVEISTTTKAADQTDYILNVMYVGDADDDAKTIPAKLIYDGKGVLMGAQLMNHVAMFNMDGNNRISKDVSFTIPENEGYKTFKVNVAGLKAGTWTVAVNGKAVGTQVASEDGGMIYFEAPAGTIKLYYHSAESNKTFDETPIVIENEPIGMMVNNFFFYTNANPIVSGDDYLVPLGLTFKALHAHVEWSKDRTSFMTTFDSTPWQVSADGITIGGEKMKPEEIRLMNGDIMVDMSSLNTIFKEYGELHYDPVINRIRVNLDAEGVIPSLTDEVLDEYPTAVQVAGMIDPGYSTTDMASALDGDPETRWVSQTEGSRHSEGIFDLGRVVHLTEMLIMFYTEPDMYSNYVFDVYTSIDGKEYEAVFENIKSGEIDPDKYFERYTTVLMDVEARYVKIMGHGRFRYTGAGRMPTAVNNAYTSISEIIFQEQAIIDPNGEPVKGNKLLAEAESFHMADGVTIEKNKYASGKETVLLNKGYASNPGAVAGSKPHLSATFIPQKTGTYYIWAKVNTAKVTSGNNMWVSVEGVTGDKYYSEQVIFNGVKCKDEKEFVWVRLGENEIQSAFAQWQKDQEYTVSIISGCNGLIIDSFVVSMDPAFCPIGQSYQATTSITGELSVNASDAIYVQSMVLKNGDGATMQKVSADGSTTKEYLDYVLNNKNLPGDITLQINADNSGKYTIWATVKVSNLSKDQFFSAISVGDTEYKYTLQKLSELAPDCKANTYVTVKLGEIEAQAQDAIFVRIKACNDGATFGKLSTDCVAADGVFETTGGKVTIQAEDGLLGKAGEETVIIENNVYYQGELVSIIENDRISGGKGVKFLRPYSAWNNLITYTSEANAHLSFKVKPDQSGEFFIWVKVYAPMDSAIYAWIDGGEDSYFWRQPLTAETYSADEDNYIWVRLWRECRKEYTLRQERFYDWTARRVYTISLRSYTAGVVLDEIYVTNDPNDQPHNHRYEENWTGDDTHHWYAPTCGCEDAERREYGEHFFDNHADKDCNICGLKNPQYAPHNYVDKICTICGQQEPIKMAGGKLTLEAEDLMLAPEGTENFGTNTTGSIIKVVENSACSGGAAVQFLKTHTAWNQYLTEGTMPIPHVSTLVTPDKTGEYCIWVKVYVPQGGTHPPAMYAYIDDDTNADTYYYRQPLFREGYSVNEQDYIWVRVYQEYRVDTALKGERTYMWTAGQTYAIRFRGLINSVLIDQIYITNDANFAPHKHTYSEQWSSNADEHWHEPTCGDTTLVADKGAHVFDSVTDTTCNTCGYVRAAHQHAFSDSWSINGTGHWHECICGDKKDYAVHTFADRICGVCGALQPFNTSGGKVTIQAEDGFLAAAGTENFITSTTSASGFYDGNLAVLDQNGQVVRFDKFHGAWNHYLTVGRTPIPHLSFYVTPDVSGEYYIWAKVYAPVNSSIYCYFDGGEDTYYWRQPLALNDASANVSDYIWVRLDKECRNGTALTNEKAYNWTAGETYALRFRGFTQYVRIDEFYITNDANDSPSKEHVHTFAQEWTTDAVSHWHAATCGHTTEIADKGVHIYTDDADATCNVCNAERQLHEHQYGDYKSDATYHWKEATCCPGITTEKEKHTLQGTVCTVCGRNSSAFTTTIQAENAQLLTDKDPTNLSYNANGVASVQRGCQFFTNEYAHGSDQIVRLNGYYTHSYTPPETKPGLLANTNPAHLSFSHTAETTGTYYIWARILVNGSTAAYLKYVEGEGKEQYEYARHTGMTSCAGKWTADAFNWVQIAVCEWTEGETYTANLRGSGLGTAFDEFVITNDASYIPG